MTALSGYLLQVGQGGLMTGLQLWVILCLVAAWRDPARSDLVAWSIATQWTAGGRILRRAAGYRFWGRLAAGLVALGAVCLVLGGLLALIGGASGGTGP